MSTLRDHNVEAIDLTMDDELDVMINSSPVAPARPSSDRRTLRTRHSLGNTITNAPKRKRAKSFSESTIENHEQPVTGKRQKMEQRKANTIVISVQRASLDAARRRWLHRHRHLFLPLLPSASVLFSNIAKEVEVSTDTAPYVPLHELDEQPKMVENGTMKDYQLHGLSFLVWMYNNGMSCILGDEMGLGKTLQTLSLLAYIKENAKGRQDPHLIVCPLSVLSSWLGESARWVPSFRTLRFHGQQSERERLKNEIRLGNLQFDLCITTYEAFVAEDGWFKTRRWTYCVLDEGHRIKNSETNLSHRVQGIGAMYRLILTGTPVQNNLVELWSLLHWLYPNVFTSASERLFKDSFDLSRGIYSLPFLKAAQDLLATIMLRRTKANVEMSVPPREELTVFIPMTEAQRFWTYRLLTRMDTLDLEQIFTTKVQDTPENQGRMEVMSHLADQIKQSEGGRNSQYKKLMNLLMQLRKVCDHPYLLRDAMPEPYHLGEHIIASSSKLIAIDKLLADILPTGERVLIFSQWTGMLDILEDFLACRSIPYARLDGSTNRARRTLDIKLFQQERSPYKVFLISTKAGGLGINLTRASYVIMCDSDWNPQNDLQAIARAHRIGQTKPVKVYRLICRGSVEDQMLDRIRRKLFLSVKVMGGTGNPTNSDSSQLGRSDILDILRKGSSALSRADDGMSLARFLDTPIGDILNDSRSREGVRNAKMKEELNSEVSDMKVEIDEKLLFDAETEERALLSGVAQVQSRLFEGKVVPNKNNKQIADEWQALQKRARVGRLVMIDGISVLADHVMAPLTENAPPVKKREREKFESEDYCNYCRDGGELLMCTSCPRVFHAKCYGFSKAQAHKMTRISCSQHDCTVCQRTTAQCGGMLFRCQTCPQAFCEDCLPESDIDAVGDVLPEFALLGYYDKRNAYYIRCHDCHQHFIESPEVWEGWEQEMRETQAKLDALAD